ncbi:MAG TPA: anaerobic sulfatase maturase [Firmicutes bacterium]|jgi:uncharacterized protein|nr:anaerobic sulfatase maturase [Bacillota bacterium]
MSDAVLEKMIASFMATEQSQYAFGWQGGEPTLMGVEFFRRVTALQEKYGHQGAVIANGLQTNATLIDDEFAEHLGQYNFLVGVSLDGPETLHNHFRRTVGGQDTHASVLKGIDCLKRHRVEFNALTVANSFNARHPLEIYHYLCDQGIYYHQYIPCVEFGPDGQPLPFTVSAEQWGRFLCEIFDEWYLKDSRKVSIRLFDAILNFMVNRSYHLCHMGGHCSQYFVVEHNGDVYPCDFFVNAQQKLGNINGNSWEQLLTSAQYQQFGAQKADRNPHCSTCKYLDFCSGDCLKHRFYGGQNHRQISWLCEGWQQFYEHALPKFEQLALKILQERDGVNKLPDLKLGRNEPCFCGSGRKYKKCHGFGG